MKWTRLIAIHRRKLGGRTWATKSERRAKCQLKLVWQAIEPEFDLVVLFCAALFKLNCPNSPVLNAYDPAEEARPSMVRMYDYWLP